MIKFLKRIFHLHKHEPIIPVIYFYGINKSMCLVECPVCGKRGFKCSDILYLWCSHSEDRNEIEEMFHFHVVDRFSLEVVLKCIQEWLEKKISLDTLIGQIKAYNNVIELKWSVEITNEYETLKHARG